MATKRLTQLKRQKEKKRVERAIQKREARRERKLAKKSEIENSGQPSELNLLGKEKRNE